MKKLLLAGLLALLALPGYAGDIAIPLAFGYEMDGEAADVDQVVTAAQIEDSKDDYTIAASPDSCRAVDLTIVDGDSSISAGTVTITGTDCFDQVKTCTYTFAAAGSGVLSADSGQDPYFKTVTKVETGVITGEGGAGDTMAVGYSTAPPHNKVAYGRFRARDTDHGYNFVDVGGSYVGQGLITTSGSASTTVTSHSDNDVAAFTNVVVGDLLRFNLNGREFYRKVTARGSATSITVNASVNIPTAGVTFNYMHFYYSPNPKDIMFIDTQGYDSLAIVWSVDSVTNTGGVDYDSACMYNVGPDFPSGMWVAITNDNTASTATQAPTDDNIDLVAAPFAFCKVEFSHVTGDDDDTGAEDLNAFAILRQQR